MEELEQQGNWLFKYRGVLPLIILFIGMILYLRTELYPESFFYANLYPNLLTEVSRTAKYCLQEQLRKRGNEQCPANT